MLSELTGLGTGSQDEGVSVSKQRKILGSIDFFAVVVLGT